MAQRVKVLIADDAPDIANRLVQMLSELNQADIVGPATDGITALALYRQYKPDVILLDFHMPGLNGLQVLEKIRAENRSSLVIMLTQENSAGFSRRCLDAGANHYFNKAENFDPIVEIIERFIQSQS